jgi:hypothetical protein
MASTASAQGAMPVATSVAPPANTGDSSFRASVSNLDDTDPSTFIALRYDATHVIFRLGDDGDFSLENPEQEKAFHPLPHQVAEYGGAPPFELDPAVLETVKEHYKAARIGEEWQMEVAPGMRVPVVIQKPIEMSWGCANNSFTAGFIAEVAPQIRTAFISTPQRYFLVHKSASTTSSQASTQPVYVAELKGWSPSVEVRSQIEQAIVSALKGEVARQEARGTYAELPRQIEEDAALGKTELSYEIHAVQLSPDGLPRLFVPARWIVNQQRGLLMSVWLRVGSEVKVEPVDEAFTRVLWLSSKSGKPLPEDEVGLDQLGSILNVFDRPDGYGDVLIYTPGYEGYSITLHHYSGAQLMATKITMGDGC